MADAPDMTDVLADAPTNWGKWGADDEVGALNYLTADEVMRGVRHIQKGEVFTLQRLIGDPKGDPVWPGRTPAERTQILDESSWDSADAPGFPGRAALRRRQDQRVPPGLDAVRRPRPRLVRRQDLERLRRPDDGRRPGQGQRRADRPARRRRPRHPAGHRPLARQDHARQGRDVHPRGPAWPAPRPRAPRSRSATS